MVENRSSEVFLSMHERLDQIRAQLEFVIHSALNKDLTESERMSLINESMENVLLHFEAAGPELGLNTREHTVLGSLKNRNGASALIIAQRCAQLLGALNQSSRYAESWESHPVIVKNAFLGEVYQALEDLIREASVENILKLEQIISGFTVHESYDLDLEVQKLCFSIEECLRETIYYGNELSVVRLKVQRNVTVTMRGKLRMGLS